MFFNGFLQGTERISKDLKHKNDMQLVADCLKGEEKAWMSLLAMCKKICHREIIMNHEYHKYDQALSDFILELLGSSDGNPGVLRRYNGSGSLCMYLTAVFRYMLIDYNRRKSNKDREKLLPEEYIDLSGVGSNEIEEVQQREESGIIKNALKQLDVAERTLIELYYYNDLSIREIGKIVGISKSTVARSLRRTLDTLEKLLSGKLD